MWSIDASSTCRNSPWNVLASGPGAADSTISATASKSAKRRLRRHRCSASWTAMRVSQVAKRDLPAN
jgi:hypothetical protein